MQNDRVILKKKTINIEYFSVYKKCSNPGQKIFKSKINYRYVNILDPSRINLSYLCQTGTKKLPGIRLVVPRGSSIIRMWNIPRYIVHRRLSVNNCHHCLESTSCPFLYIKTPMNRQ